jgi:hypothetical protein
MEATREEAYFELEGFERLKFWNMAVALQIYRELAKKDPEAYLRFVPMTLNDLAFVDNAQNRWAQARSEVSEALKRAESTPGGGCASHVRFVTVSPI